jgi:uncharacterized protein
MALFKRAHRSDTTNKLYYASDVHGSDVCWRKFLGAARFYGADALIMGGDLTGKAIVPIELDGTHFSATFLGENRSGDGEETIADLEAAIRYNGMYPWRATAGEIARHRDDPDAREKLFEQVMLAELARWVALADERLGPQGTGVYVIGGNDDPWSCDHVLRGGHHVTFCDDQVVEVAGHEMLSLSYANPTPWNSPRELDEDALYTRIHALAERLERPSQAIFNLHVPPYDSTLYSAVEIAPDLTPVYESGQPRIAPVGSRAVRQVIEEYQPLLSLHGHIHESRADARIGRTLAINSGSEYSTGRIHGALVTLDDDSVAAHQFVIG